MRTMTRANGRRIALAALILWLSGRAASGDAGPETDNAVATLCGIVETSAKVEGLPVGFFIKLIWRESAFRPNAISPAGAQGVAQFMPGTAAARGLADPFDPASAIPASANIPTCRSMADLRAMPTSAAPLFSGDHPQQTSASPYG